MMPKTTLIAPAGVSGQIHASHSGKNYDIGEDGTVVVDGGDVRSLLGAGYQHVPPGPKHRERVADAPPVTSDAFGSQEVGASALDPADREALHRAPPHEQAQENHDHGDARAPHDDPGEGVSTAGSRADAAEELATAERAGADDGQRSQVPDTGHMGSGAATAADQDAARGA